MKTPHAYYWHAVSGVVTLSLLVCIAPRVLEHTSVGTQMLGAVLSATIVDKTNDIRVEKQQGALVYDVALSAAAQAKADDMLARQYFAHNSPEGLPPWHWFDAAGYDYHHAGENLAKHFTESSEVVRAWVASPEHYKNLVNPAYTQIGIGIAQGTLDGVETTIVVQFFASKPAPAPIAAAVAEVAQALTPIAQAEEKTQPQASSAPRIQSPTAAPVRVAPRPFIPVERNDAVSQPVQAATLEEGSAAVSAPVVPPVRQIVTTPYEQLSLLELVYTQRYQLAVLLLLTIFAGALAWYLLHAAYYRVHIPHVAHGSVVVASCALIFLVGLAYTRGGVDIPRDTQFAAAVQSIQ